MLPKVNNENNSEIAEEVLSAIGDYISEVRGSATGSFMGTLELWSKEVKAGVLEGMVEVSKDLNDFYIFEGIGVSLKDIADTLHSLIDDLRDQREDEKIQKQKDHFDNVENERESEKTKKISGKSGKNISKLKHGVGDFMSSIFSSMALLLTPSMLGASVLSKISSSFASFMKKTMSLGFSTILKFPGLTGLLGGVVSGVMDAMESTVKAIDWNVTGAVAAITGFMVGSDRTIRGNFLSSLSTWATVAKWAGIGAGLGSVFPVVGTLIGGALGAGVGLILEWFGPERISRFLTAVKEEFGKFSDVFFGTNFYLDTASLETKISDTNDYISKQVTEYEENLKKLSDVDAKLALARKNGNESLVSQLEDQKIELESNNEILLENINASKSRISELKADAEMANMTYLERIGEYLGLSDVSEWLGEKYEIVKNKISDTFDGLVDFFVEWIDDLYKYLTVDMPKNAKRLFMDSLPESVRFLIEPQGMTKIENGDYEKSLDNNVINNKDIEIGRNRAIRDLFKPNMEIQMNKVIAFDSKDEVERRYQTDIRNLQEYANKTSVVQQSTTNNINAGKSVYMSPSVSDSSIGSPLHRDW